MNSITMLKTVFQFPRRIVGLCILLLVMTSSHSAKAQTPDIIIDNADASGVTKVGAWSSSNANSGFYDTDYLHDGNTGKGTKSVTFTPNLPSSGDYTVYALSTDGINRSIANPGPSNRAASVPIDILDAGATTTVIVNQQVNNGVWQPLGVYNLSAGTGSSVTIRTTGTTGYVVADAVRFIKSSTPLPIPFTLTAQDQDQSVILTWTASTNVTSYDVWGKDEAGAFTALATGLTELSWVDTKLQNGTNYTYYVKAVGPGGTTNSNQVVSTVGQVPDALRLSDVTATSVVVTVPALPEGAIRLKVQRKRQDEAESVWSDPAARVIMDSLQGGASFVAGGMASGVAYDFRCRAVYDGPPSVAGAIVSVTTLAAPSAPGAPSFENSTDTGVTIVAPPLPSGALWLEIQARLASAPTFQNTTDTITGGNHLAGGERMDYNQASANASYVFRCVAVSGTLRVAGPEAGIAFYPSPSPDSDPLKPMVSGTGTGVQLDWAPVTGANSYKIYRSTSSDSPLAYLATVPASTTLYTDAPLDPSAFYYYAISTVGANGEGAPCAVRGASPRNIQPPKGLQAIAGSAQVSLSWLVSDGATSYALKRATTSGGTYTTVASSLTGLTKTDTGQSH